MSLAILLGPEHKTVVLVAYSDETGTGNDAPMTMVTAVLFNMDSQWPPVSVAIEALEPNRHREIKGARLFKDLRNGRQRESANKVLAGVLDLLFQHRVPVFQGAIRLDWFRGAMTALKSPEADIYDMALAICLHRVDTWMHAVFPHEQIVWISDNAGHYEKRLTDSLALWRGNVGVPQTMPQGLHIADTFYFGDSKTSRALQIADVCSSVIREHLLKNPDAQSYFDMLRPQLMNDPTPYPDAPVNLRKRDTGNREESYSKKSRS